LIDWVLFSISINLLLFFVSIGFYLIIDKICPKNPIQKQEFPIRKSDWFLSLITIIVNSLVLLAAVYLWKTHWISVNDSASYLQIGIEVICITIAMDFLMYVFHYLAHLPFFYKAVHSKHHQHVNTNYLSLFVLHPIETFGFGMMMLFVFACYDFSIYAISIYLFVNLIWGTIGHLNKEFFPDWTAKLQLGTSRFHNQHHSDERCNFGFYTSIWDKLFRTHK